MFSASPFFCPGGQHGASEEGKPKSAGTDDPIAASARRLLRSDMLLGSGVSRVQLTRTLLGDSYRRLARLDRPPGIVLPPHPPAGSKAGDEKPAGGTSAGQNIAGWPHPARQQLDAGRALLAGAGMIPANDQPQRRPLPPKRAMTAADLARLAEAAILLDLPDIGEILTTAAYRLLDGDAAAHTAAATAALREALTVIACRSPADSF